MNRTSKFAFLAALVAIGISSPVLASQRPGGRSIYGAVPREGRIAHGIVTRNGLNAYARVPQQDLNSPLLDGGGSSGYNMDEKFH